MKKIAAILLSAILACSFMVGCGDEDDSSSKKSSKNDSEVSAVDESGEDESKEDESKDDASSEDESKADDSSEDESKPDESKADESKADESKPDESKPDESKADESKPDESKGDTPADAAAFEGKWECESMSISNYKFEDNFMGVPIAIMLQLELQSGGKGIQYDNSEGVVTEYDLTWTASGSTCTITIDGDSLDFELQNGKLVADYSEEGLDQSVTLKKVDKFTEFTEEDMENVFGDIFGDEE